MSVFCPRNSLSETATIRDPGTTLLSSYALRSKLSACFRPSRRPTVKKSSPCTRMLGLQAFVGEMTRRCHASGESSSLQKMSVMLSLPLGCVQRSAHCLSQFPTHAWLLCLGVLVWQSDENVAPHQRRSGLDSRLGWRSRKGPRLEKRLLDMQH